MKDIFRIKANVHLEMTVFSRPREQPVQMGVVQKAPGEISSRRIYRALINMFECIEKGFI